MYEHIGIFVYSRGRRHGRSPIKSAAPWLCQVARRVGELSIKSRPRSELLSSAGVRPCRRPLPKILLKSALPPRHQQVPKRCPQGPRGGAQNPENPAKMCLGTLPVTVSAKVTKKMPNWTPSKPPKVCFRAIGVAIFTNLSNPRNGANSLQHGLLLGAFSPQMPENATPSANPQKY